MEMLSTRNRHRMMLMKRSLEGCEIVSDQVALVVRLHDAHKHVRLSHMCVMRNISVQSARVWRSLLKSAESQGR